MALPGVCTIKIAGAMGDIGCLRARLCEACAAEDAAVIFDVRDADHSCIQHVVALVTMVRESEGLLRNLRGIAIVVTHDWARTALRCALAVVPEITRYIVTDTIEEASTFCARAVHESSLSSFPPSPRSSGRKRKRGLIGLGGRETKGAFVGTSTS